MEHQNSVTTPITMGVDPFLVEALQNPRHRLANKCQGLLASVLTAGILSILLLKPPGKGGGQGQDQDPGLEEDSVQMIASLKIAHSD